MALPFSGPLTIKYKDSSILVYFFLTSGRREMMKVFYGSLYFYIPERIIRNKARLNYSEKIIQTEEIEDICFNQLMDFLEKFKPIEAFRRRGIVLSGEKYLSSSYLYILGQKKLIRKPEEGLSEGFFYASDEKKAKEIFSEMALAHFKKRVDYYSPLMGIDKKPQVGVSKAIDYLGVNNLRKNTILLNAALYAYKEEVGDAVIVHELAHCLVKNHTKEFYGIVVKYCPDYYRYEKIILSGTFSAN